MSVPIAISVKNVSKAYRVWDNPAARLTSPFLAAAGNALGWAALKKRAARGYRDFWALRDVSFEVKRGEAVGIIGRNGSGKSTLLQIIAGTLQPTEGTIKVNGRVAALLELGSGFNPDFTGRENVFLNGAVLGLTRAEIEARFDSIAAFADIGEFIDQPVKTYSSGMMMRLAFSVQTAVDPEILIVDEALSVGDAQFVAKCIKRVSDFIRAGGTLLFVSHDSGLVKQLTTKAVYLDFSRQVAFDDTVAVTLAYSEAMAAANNAAPDKNPDRYSSPDAAYSIGETTIGNNKTATIDTFQPGAPATLVVRLRAGASRAPSRLVFSIYNYLGLIACSGAYDLPAPPTAGAPLLVRVHLPKLRLAPGSYRANFAVRSEIEIMSWARNAVIFRVAGETTETYIYREDMEVSFDFAG